MGQMVILEIMASEQAALEAVLVRPGSPDKGEAVMVPDKPIGTGLKYGDDPAAPFASAGVVIDFSTPEAGIRHAQIAAETETPLVIGTTGFSEEQLSEIRKAAEKAPILLSYNMSPGITAIAGALKSLSDALGEAFHLEITDIHHAGKKDAPSGTALMLGQASGRAEKDIKYTSHREGHIIGEHRILFSGPLETIEITHVAKDRRLFAKGALMAALWLKDQKPGLYDLNDVLKT